MLDSLDDNITKNEDILKNKKLLDNTNKRARMILIKISLKK